MSENSDETLESDNISSDIMTENKPAPSNIDIKKSEPQAVAPQAIDKKESKEAKDSKESGEPSKPATQESKLEKVKKKWSFKNLSFLRRSKKEKASLEDITAVGKASKIDENEPGYAPSPKAGL